MKLGRGISDIVEISAVAEVFRDGPFKLYYWMRRCTAMMQGKQSVIKLAIENRYALTTIHAAYIQSLRLMGIRLPRFAEGEMMLESSSSTSSILGASEPPVVLPEKSPSPSPFSSSSLSPSLPQSLHGPPVVLPEKSPSPFSSSSLSPSLPQSLHGPPAVLPENSPSPFSSSSLSPSVPQSLHSERAESPSPLHNLSSHGNISPASYASLVRTNYMRSGGYVTHDLQGAIPIAREW